MSPGLKMGVVGVTVATLITGVAVIHEPSLAQIPEAFCGNNVCEEGENCASCFADCGLCTSLTAIEQEVGVCGNNECTVDEDCMSCPQDCKRCLGAEEVRRMAERLHVYLAAPENSTLESRFTTKDLERLERLRSASELDFWTRNRVARMLRALERAITVETQVLAANFTILLQSKTLPERWPLLNAERMREALETHNVQELLSLIPPSQKDLKTLSQELEKIAESFSNLKTFAAEEGHGLDPKERFSTAVSLLDQAEKQALDPRETLGSLETKLLYLLENATQEEVREGLSHILDIAGTPSLTLLSELLRSMRQLRRAAGFDGIDSSTRVAAHAMRSPVQQLHASVLRGESLSSEASEVLDGMGQTDVLEALENGDFEGMKQSLIVLLEEENEEIQKLLLKLPDTERTAITETLAMAKQKLQEAASQMELRAALTEFNEAVQNAQRAVRVEKGAFIRFIYAVQDFLGIQ